MAFRHVDGTLNFQPHGKTPTRPARDVVGLLLAVSRNLQQSPTNFLTTTTPNLHITHHVGSGESAVQPQGLHNLARETLGESERVLC